MYLTSNAIKLVSQRKYSKYAQKWRVASLVYRTKSRNWKKRKVTKTDKPLNMGKSEIQSRVRESSKPNTKHKLGLQQQPAILRFFVNRIILCDYRM